jgi:hypothetical protein
MGISSDFFNFSATKPEINTSLSTERCFFFSNKKLNMKKKSVESVMEKSAIDYVDLSVRNECHDNEKEKSHKFIFHQS